MTQTLTILDGGMGQELTQRMNTRGGLWSAQALVDTPELVREVHHDYLVAGARVLITNTYSTIPSYLDKADLGGDYLSYARQAGEIARSTADAFPAEVTVLGSIPPLEESFRPDLVPSDDEAQSVYRPLVDVLADYVDGYICETMSCVREAVNAASAVRSMVPEKELWIAWTLHETPGKGLRSGESIAAAVQAVEQFEADAYLFNCTSPQAISSGLQELTKLTDKATGAYPNRLVIPEGWTLDNEVASGMRELTPEEFVQLAQHWQTLGAQIIGGCCGVGPELIHALSNSQR